MLPKTSSRIWYDKGLLAKLMCQPVLMYLSLPLCVISYSFFQFHKKFNFGFVADNVNPGPQHSVFGQGMGPTSYGEAYIPLQNNRNNFSERTFVDRAQEQKRVEDAEDLDVNAQIHGNWTVENAKSKLHQFMQSHKVHADYKYTQVGPDHNR